MLPQRAGRESIAALRARQSGLHRAGDHELQHLGRAEQAGGLVDRAYAPHQPEIGRIAQSQQVRGDRRVVTDDFDNLLDELAGLLMT